MGPLPHWYGITIVFKVLVEESYKGSLREGAPDEVG